MCVPDWTGVLPAAFLPLLQGLERGMCQDRLRVVLQARELSQLQSPSWPT